jgi:hypothetical protein
MAVCNKVEFQKSELWNFEAILITSGQTALATSNHDVPRNITDKTTQHMPRVLPKGKHDFVHQ